MKVYALRSKYAHELREIQRHLKIPQIAGYDVFRWENEPNLTFNGLLRLLTHVLINFVNGRPAIEREAINWTQQLPSVVMMRMSPEYYIFRTENVVAAEARPRLEGFLSLLTVLWLGGENKIADFTPILNQLCGLYHQAPEKDKRAIYVLAEIWQRTFTANPLSSESQRLLEENKQVVAKCTQETMIAAALRNEMAWGAEEMAKVYESYEKNRVKPEKPCYPQGLDLLILLHIAAKFKAEGKTDEHKLWLEKARLDAPGSPDFQQVIKEMIDGADRQNLFDLVFPPRPAREQASKAPEKIPEKSNPQ